MAFYEKYTFLKKTMMVQKITIDQVEVLRKSMDLTKKFLEELNEDLQKSVGPWICGEKLTMADIAWHVSLLRFLTFGCDYLYQDLPEVLQIYIIINVLCGRKWMPLVEFGRAIARWNCLGK